MELRKIDTLEELRREKFRLQHEAGVARELFQKQIIVTIDEGKKAVLGSWKSSVPVVAFAAIKRFVKKKAAEAPHDPNPLVSSMEDSLRVFRGSGPEKWFSLVPILKNLLDEWILGDREKKEPIISGSNTESIGKPMEMNRTPNPENRPAVTY